MNIVRLQEKKVNIQRSNHFPVYQWTSRIWNSKTVSFTLGPPQIKYSGINVTKHAQGMNVWGKLQNWLKKN